LFLIPGEAKKEFDMKINAQRRELERTFTEIAYRTIMTESIPLQVALGRANPTIPNSDVMAEKIYINSVFGAMVRSFLLSSSSLLPRTLSLPLSFSPIGSTILINLIWQAKHPFPVANLLAAARHANMYTPPSGDGKHSVMLVPPGMLDIAHYTVGIII
jgi:hypothetical protein